MSDQPPPAVVPTPVEPSSCLNSIVKGTAIGGMLALSLVLFLSLSVKVILPGAVIGTGFHMVAGPTAIVIGQPNLQMKQIGRFCCHRRDTLLIRNEPGSWRH
jgi:hypothetical protein